MEPFVQKVEFVSSEEELPKFLVDDTSMEPIPGPHPEASDRAAVKRPATEINEIDFKKARTEIVWRDSDVAALLHFRRKFARIFEQNKDRAISRAWSRVANIMTPYLSCSGQDCRKKFESLLFEYLLLKDQEHEGPKNASDWKYYSYYEKLFEQSRPFAEKYRKFFEPLAVDEEAGDELLLEYSEAAMEAYDVMSKFDTDIAMAYIDLKDERRRRYKRLRKIENLYLYLKYLREEKDFLITSALKGITDNFSREDDTRRQWCLQSLTLSSAFSMSGLFSTAIPIIYNHFSHLHSKEEQLESILLAYFTYLLSVSRLVEQDDTEDQLIKELIPESEMRSCIARESIQRPTTLETLNFKSNLNVFSSTVENLIKRIGCYLSHEKFLRPMSFERQIVLCLWYLTHKETIEQITIRFGVRFLDAKRAITSVTLAMTNCSDLIVWPRTRYHLKRTVLGFETIDDVALPGVVGAIGWKDFCIKETVYGSKGKSVYNSKVDRIGVQVVADSKHFFTNVHIDWVHVNSVPTSGTDNESNSDDSVDNEEIGEKKILEKQLLASKLASFFVSTPLGRSMMKPITSQKLQDRQFYLPPLHHLVGDHTYPLTMGLMVPFAHKAVSKGREYLFNLYLDQARVFINRALGKLIARFPRLLCLDSDMKPQIPCMIKAMILIHNVCISRQDDFSETDVQLPAAKCNPCYAKASTLACAKRLKLAKGFVNHQVEYLYRDKETEKM